MVFGREDLSQCNRAKSPWFKVAQNGQTDIGLEIGNEQKIGLTSDGMYMLMNEWLESSHGLTREQKDSLILKLQK